MKIIAKLKNFLISENLQGFLTLQINNLSHIEMLNELDEEKTYSLTIKEVKNKRSARQNDFFWSLVHEIDTTMNGKPDNELEIYMMLLERAGAKYEYIACLKEAEPLLKEAFRLTKPTIKIDLNGKEGYWYKCFYGSSKMNTKEMNQLIDTALDVAGELGLDLDYWNGVLK